MLYIEIQKRVRIITEDNWVGRRDLRKVEVKKKRFKRRVL